MTFRVNRDLVTAGIAALVLHVVAVVVLAAIDLEGPAAVVPPRSSGVVVHLVSDPSPATTAVDEPTAAIDPPAAPPSARARPTARTAPAALVAILPDRSPDAPRPAALDAAAPSHVRVLPSVVLAAPAPLALHPLPMADPALPEPGARAATDPAAAPDATVGAMRPQAIGNDPPTYPRLARRRGWEGTVSLRVRVRADGGVERVEVDRTSGYVTLDRAAARAAEGWRFRPATRDGRAIAMWIEIPVEFMLHEGVARAGA